MVRAVDLMARGLFPRELPPTFTSHWFAMMVDTLSIPSPDGKYVTQHCGHSLARVGSLRRQLSIPNPLSFIGLSRAFEDNWPCISAHLDECCTSISRPTLVDSGRAIEPYGTLGVREQARLRMRSGARFLTRADVSTFYHSVYTHSVPWVLHGKSFAKANRNTAALCGNLIDKAIRNSQNGQTIGLPIGPDTSLVVAECLLSSVDCALIRAGHQRFIRYLDDYEISCETRQQADDVLGLLEGSLASLELRLNPVKTTVVELPQPLGEAWMGVLRDFEFDNTTPRREVNSLMRFYDLAIEVQARHPLEYVFSYALARMLAFECHAENAESVQYLMIGASTAEAGCLPRVIAGFQSIRLAGRVVLLDQLERHLNETIAFHARRGHHSEVAWSIYGCMLFELMIHEGARVAIEACDDDCVALMALRANSANLFTGALQTARWEALLEQDELRGQHWLLAYEAVASRLLVPGGSNYLEVDEHFGRLYRTDVQFTEDINVSAPIVISSPGAHDCERGAPEPNPYSWY